MSDRIEVESKFFCKDKDTLYKIIKELNMKKQNEIREIDEYFTDMNCKFIKDRTCLRIRNTNNKEMELTFKGKSKKLGSTYAKKESNIKFDIRKYNEILKLLNNLGYYSYVKVKKNRNVYTKKHKNLIYNVMIDEIQDVGEFVELELLSNNDKVPTQKLKEQLDKFILNFKAIKLKSVNLPYRDLVAKQQLKKIKNLNKIKALMLDLDGTLIDSEQAFYETFKEVIYENYNYSINKKQYIENELKRNNNLIQYLKNKNIINKNISNEKLMEKVYKKYEENFSRIIKNNETLTNIKLLKILKENNNFKLSLVTTCSKRFITKLIEELKIKTLFSCIIAREDVENLKPDSEAYAKAIKKLKINKEQCLAVEDSERGILSAKESKIPVVCVDKYALADNSIEDVVHINSFEQLALLLLAKNI